MKMPFSSNCARFALKRVWHGVVIVALLAPQAHSVVYVDGDIRSFPFFSRTSYFQPDTDFVFTKSPGVYSLLLNDLQAMDRDNATKGPFLLFANTQLDDILFELAKIEACEKGKSSEATPEKPAFVALNYATKSQFSIAKKGEYEVWLKINGDESDLIRKIRMDNFLFHLPVRGFGVDWIRLSKGDLESGMHTIELVFEKKTEPQDQMDDLFKEAPSREVLIISRDKFRKDHERLQKSQNAYLFYKTEKEYMLRRSFYVPRADDYDVATYMIPRYEKIRASKLNVGEGSWRAGGRRPMVLFGGNFYPVTNTTLPLQSEGWRWQSNNENRLVIPNEDGVGRSPIGEMHLFKMFYPLQEGVWRWMSNDGSLSVLNPFDKPIQVQLDFDVVSFQVDRTVEVWVNGTLQQQFTAEGPHPLPSKSTLRNIQWPWEVGIACGKPFRAKIGPVTLLPGANDVRVSIMPGASVINEMDPLSIAIRDDVNVELVSPNSDRVGYLNRPEFHVESKESGMVFHDTYNRSENEIGWVSKSAGNIRLRDYPLLAIKYDWRNPIQSMDVGFTIDTGKSADRTRMLIVSLPIPGDEERLYYFDLLDAVRKTYSSALDPHLTEIHFLPHKTWDVDATDQEEAVNYVVKSVQLSSVKGSIAKKEEISLDGALWVGKGSNSVDAYRNEFSVSMHLGETKSLSSWLDVRVPLNPGSLDLNSKMIVPFRFDDPKVQGLKLLFGLDSNGDGKADSWVPVGKRIPLLDWKIMVRDNKDGMNVYESAVPGDLLQYEVGSLRLFNFIVMKNGVPMPTTTTAGYFSSKEIVDFDAGRVTITLPPNESPDEFTFDLYLPPQIDADPMLPHFFNIPVDLQETLPKDRARIVELRFLVEALLPKPIANERSFEFEVKSPQIVDLKLIRTEDLLNNNEIPMLQVDGTAPVMNRVVDVDGGGVWMTSRVRLQEGMHSLRVWEKRGIRPYFVQVNPSNRSRAAVRDERDVYELKKENPTAYHATVLQGNIPFTLILSQNYNAGWRASARMNDGQRQVFSTHFEINGHENAWRMPALPEGTQIDIQYTPQRLMNFGYFVSLFAVIFCFLYLIVSGYRREKTHV